MRRQIAILVLALPLIMANKGCEKTQTPPPSNTKAVCEFVKRTFYPRCSFKFTDDEIDHLSEENQKKATTVKLFFQTCPQYKVCKDAAAK